eukprot:g53591.t1
MQRTKQPRSSTIDLAPLNIVYCHIVAKAASRVGLKASFNNRGFQRSYMFQEPSKMHVMGKEAITKLSLFSPKFAFHGSRLHCKNLQEKISRECQADSPEKSLTDIERKQEEDLFRSDTLHIDLKDMALLSLAYEITRSVFDLEIDSLNHTKLQTLIKTPRCGAFFMFHSADPSAFLMIADTNFENIENVSILETCLGVLTSLIIFYFIGFGIAFGKDFHGFIGISSFCIGSIVDIVDGRVVFFARVCKMDQQEKRFPLHPVFGTYLFLFMHQIVTHVKFDRFVFACAEIQLKSVNAAENLYEIKNRISSA